MRNNGFIKLNRTMLTWEWYDHHYTKIVFLHILLKANWRDENWHGKIIKKGQLVTSIRKLAKELKISIQHTRTALTNLQTTHEITITSTNKYSIITVFAWDKYQLDNTQTNTQVNTQTTHKLTHKQHTISEEEEEYKNIYRERARTREEKPVLEDSENRTVVDAYNSICSNLKPIGIKNYSTELAELDQALVNDYLNYDQVIQAFKKANANDFLTGKVNGFIADFKWMINPNHILDILEGKYERNYSNKPATKTKKKTSIMKQEYDFKALRQRNLIKPGGS